MFDISYSHQYVPIKNCFIKCKNKAYNDCTGKSNLYFKLCIMRKRFLTDYCDRTCLS